MEKKDFKKEYKDLYLPQDTPVEIEIPSMLFIEVDGKGNPNDEGGEYQAAVELLYGLSYTLKMSPKSGAVLDGYFDYVVPPLEGLWWMKGETEMDFTQKDKYLWISMIRQPEFVTQEAFLWAREEVKRKKPFLDVSKARLVILQEGLCVQCMHLGPYDDERRTVAKIEAYVHDHGLAEDIGTIRPDGTIKRHHEIYLGDPRKTKPEALKTVIRHPVRHEQAYEIQMRYAAKDNDFMERLLTTQEGFQAVDGEEMSTM